MNPATEIRRKSSNTMGANSIAASFAYSSRESSPALFDSIHQPITWYVPHHQIMAKESNLYRRRFGNGTF